MRDVLEILNELKPGVDYENSTDLIDSQKLDSLDVISIVSEFTDEYDIEIPFDEIVPENFNSVAAMKEMIKRLSE